MQFNYFIDSPGSVEALAGSRLKPSMVLAEVNGEDTKGQAYKMSGDYWDKGPSRCCSRAHTTTSS